MTTPNWPAFAAAVVAALAVGAVCGAALAGLSAPLAGRGHLDQALLTLGCALVLADLVVVLFGRDVHGVAAPPGLDGSVSIAGEACPVYRLALIGVGLALALAIYVIVERTRLGSLVRAAVADRAMLEAMGVDSRKVLLGVFAARVRARGGRRHAWRADLRRTARAGGLDPAARARRGRDRWALARSRARSWARC